MGENWNILAHVGIILASSMDHFHGYVPLPEGHQKLKKLDSIFKKWWRNNWDLQSEMVTFLVVWTCLNHRTGRIEQWTVDSDGFGDLGLSPENMDLWLAKKTICHVDVEKGKPQFWDPILERSYMRVGQTCFFWIPDVLAEFVPNLPCGISEHRWDFKAFSTVSVESDEILVAGCEPSYRRTQPWDIHISQYLNYNSNCNNYTGWCFGTWFVWLSIQLGIINHPNWLTNSYFFKRGRLKAPTSNYITLRHPHDTHQKIIWLVVSFFSIKKNG